MLSKREKWFMVAGAAVIALALVAAPLVVDAASGGVSVYGKGSNGLPTEIGASGDRLKTEATLTVVDGGFGTSERPMRVDQTGAIAGRNGAQALRAGAIDGGYLPAQPVPDTADAGVFEGRTGLTVQNLGFERVWCGLSAGTSDLNGTQLDPAPDTMHAGGAFAAPNGSAAPIFCWTRNAQTSPADLRWMEVR